MPPPSPSQMESIKHMLTPSMPELPTADEVKEMFHSRFLDANLADGYPEDARDKDSAGHWMSGPSAYWDAPTPHNIHALDQKGFTPPPFKQSPNRPVAPPPKSLPKSAHKHVAPKSPPRKPFSYMRHGLSHEASPLHRRDFGT